ncbi:unnamed protein product, partial [Prorocentrum cordatum]
HFYIGDDECESDVNLYDEAELILAELLEPLQGADEAKIEHLEVDNGDADVATLSEVKDDELECIDGIGGNGSMGGQKGKCDVGANANVDL